MQSDFRPHAANASDIFSAAKHNRVVMEESAITVPSETNVDDRQKSVTQRDYPGVIAPVTMPVLPTDHRFWDVEGPRAAQSVTKARQSAPHKLICVE